MKVPDKIYAGYRFKNNYEDLYARKTQLTNRDTEYIRKDTLLEWLNGKVYEHNEDRFDDGFNTALGQIIDKLNLM